MLDFDSYRLSNGYSLDLSHWACAPFAKQGIFERKRVYVHEKDETKRSNWVDILEYGSAQLVSRKDFKVHSADYILCETQPDKDDFNFIYRHDGQVVTAEVLVLM